MRLTTALILTMLTAAGLAAQEPTQREGRAGQADLSEKPFQYNGNGHVYFATGVCRHNYTHVGVGGGVEGFLWRGLTLGGSGGYHYFVNDIGFGLASLDLGYHFTDRSRPKRLDPFVNFSPLGVAFAGGVAGTGGVGGGVNYWFKEKLGLRTEVRFQGIADGETLVMFRIGVNFR